MNAKLNPQALKALRKRNGLSQKELAERSHCSVAQISRWERGLSLDIHDSSRERLTKALGARWEELIRQPDEAALKEENRWTFRLNVRVSGETRFALELVGQLYGIKWADIIEVAPLLYYLLAEKSLEVRRERLSEIEALIEQTKEQCRRAAPHIADAFVFESDGEGDMDAMTWERKAIEDRELTGPCFVDTDFAKADAFVNFLEELMTPATRENVGISGGPLSGLPDYQFSDEFIRSVAGLPDPVDPNDESEQASAVHLLSTGQIDPREFFEKRKGLSDDEFRTWLLEQTDAAWKQRWAGKQKPIDSVVES